MSEQVKFINTKAFRDGYKFGKEEQVTRLIGYGLGKAFGAAFSAGRNIYRYARSNTSNELLNGVFFGIDETARRTAGKPIEQDGLAIYQFRISH